MIAARLRKAFAAGKDSAAFLLDIAFETNAPICALFGPSGSGKTLTLDCIAGFLRPDAGRILLDERILFDAQSRLWLPPQQRSCGYVFQNYSLFPHMSVRGNLEFAGHALGTRERRTRVKEMLERFGLSPMAGRFPHELSGGQKQRCSIARALVTQPKLLLLDEPSRGLDTPLRTELYEILREVRSAGTPVLLVTHSLDECLELADDLLILAEGRVLQQGKPPAVLARPASLEIARLLGAYTILPIEVGALDPARNGSTLRLGSQEFSSVYYPGRLHGDRLHLLVSPSELHAASGNGQHAANEVAGALVRAVPTPRAMRLEFDNGLAAEVSWSEWEAQKNQKTWRVRFPSGPLRLL